LRDQIARVRDLANRIDEVIGRNSNIDDDSIREKVSIERRIHDAQKRQENIAKRYEKVRKALTKVGPLRELSDKEKAWIDEVSALSNTLLPSPASSVDSDSPSSPSAEGPELWKRYNKVKSLKKELVRQADEVTQPEDDTQTERGDSASGTVPSVRVPSEVRSQKIKQVMGMLERESALVEGAKARLERLTLA
jgi:nucleoporin NUP82